MIDDAIKKIMNKNDLLAPIKYFEIVPLLVLLANKASAMQSSYLDIVISNLDFKFLPIAIFYTITLGSQSE